MSRLKAFAIRLPDGVVIFQKATSREAALMGAIKKLRDSGLMRDADGAELLSDAEAAKIQRTHKRA